MLKGAFLEKSKYAKGLHKLLCVPATSTLHAASGLAQSSDTCIYRNVRKVTTWYEYGALRNSIIDDERGVYPKIHCTDECIVTRRHYCFATVGSFAITMQHSKCGRQYNERAAYI